MCLAVPAEVVELQGSLAVVDFGGIRRRISAVLVPEVKLGDYVLVHTGMAIEIIDEAEAQRTLELVRAVDAAGAAEDAAPTSPAGDA